MSNVIIWLWLLVGSNSSLLHSRKDQSQESSDVQIDPIFFGACKIKICNSGVGLGEEEGKSEAIPHPGAFTQLLVRQKNWEDLKMPRYKNAEMQIWTCKNSEKQGPCAALTTSQKSLRVENWSCFGYGT